MLKYLKINIFFLTLIAVVSGCGNDKNRDINQTTRVEFPSYLEYKCEKIENPDRVTFCINPDETYVSIGKSETEEDVILLEKILTVFPRRMRERVVTIEFSAENFSEGSAAVNPIDTDKVQWNMWVNTNSEAMNDEKGQMETVAHELKHYLTLNSTQESNNPALCGNLMGMLENCPKESSIYFDFIQKFWKPIYNDKIWPNGDYNSYYDRHPDDFVTPYAVTNSGEDIAESFAEFIFQNKPSDLSLEKNKKIAYFWNFSEFEILRKEIRENLNKYSNSL